MSGNEDGRAARPEDDGFRQVLCRDRLTRPGQHGEVEVAGIARGNIQRRAEHDLAAPALDLQAWPGSSVDKSFEATTFSLAPFLGAVHEARYVKKQPAHGRIELRNLHGED